MSMQPSHVTPPPQEDSSRPKIIAIAGASGSGKTYLAEALAATLGAPVVSLDSYYLDLSHVEPALRSQTNFDHPEKLDWPLLRKQLAQITRGEAIEVPVYDFATHTRTSHTTALCPTRFVVLEGIFGLCDATVRDLLTLAVFVDFDDAGCLKRRMERDIAERGRTPECVLRQYTQTVRPMYEEFIAPTRQFARIVLRGDAPVEESVERLREALSLSPEAPLRQS